MRQDHDHGEWPDPQTVFHPLSALDAALAARLVERYQEVLERDLVVEEQKYSSGYAPPLIEVGAESDGDRVLRASFGGGVATAGWDGTEEDALAVVEDLAVSAAENASHDYWLDGGWRTRTTAAEADPDQ